MVAKRMGKAAFLAPEMVTSPSKGTPPDILNFAILEVTEFAR